MSNGHRKQLMMALLVPLFALACFGIVSSAAGAGAQAVPPDCQETSQGAKPAVSLAATPLPSLAKQFALGVKRIVIDPGHGGKDRGATASDQVAEKDLTLILAKALKENLETEIGCQVILTRTHDHFLPLEQRAKIANEHNADLFISIHTNAHVDRSYSGVSTYSLNFAKDREAARVAALENAFAKNAISDLKPLLEKLLLTTKITESAALARQIQRNMVAKLRTKGDKMRDLGVKQAPFCVLLGTHMPSVLIETGFISNKKDEMRLNSKAFQQNLVKGISAGVKAYIQEGKKAAKAGEL
jgi:N-acetylmuramoyl-L-alanine amidase